jgi:hypothetical protein
MDLLTVVLHELGRALGYTTDDAAAIPVMQPTLTVGERVTFDVAAVSRALNPSRAVAPLALSNASAEALTAGHDPIVVLAPAILPVTDPLADSLLAAEAADAAKDAGETGPLGPRADVPAAQRATSPMAPRPTAVPGPGITLWALVAVLAVAYTLTTGASTLAVDRRRR